MKVLLLASCLLGAALAQQAGEQNPTETKPEFTLSVCDDGGCSTESTKIVLDANWRWTHETGGYQNCYTGNLWDNTLCPDPNSCAENCAVENLGSGELSGTYGITPSGSDSFSMRFVTQGTYSTNVGSRVFLTDESGSAYRMFQLLNREFTFTVDSSNLQCGLNGALYFVEMDQDGGLSYSGNNAGAAYGTGYCDAQCPHDIKWVQGAANIIDWKPQENDANSGNGYYGSCCPELDLWEANIETQAFTTHPCENAGEYACEGNECGDGDNRYGGVCDKDGCDFASYRMGDKNYYGPDATVDSSQPITVVTQFITSDGSDSGDLVEVRRLYVQNGQVIENSAVNFDGVEAYDSITDQMCADVKDLFGDENDHERKGGLRAMGDAMDRGMVLVMSLWDDHSASMLWLDSVYPEDGDPSQPGIERGPCPTTSGRPEDVEANQPGATVVWSNIKVGTIGSTY